MLIILFLIVKVALSNTIQFDYSSTFKEDSEVTMVITSCGRMNFLSHTIASFLQNNDYPLKEIIIVDDCQTPQSQILDCFLKPKNPEYLKKYVKILINQENVRLTKSVDRAYKEVKTQYVLHFEDDWGVHNFKGKVLAAKKLLEYADENDIKISQVTYGRTLSHHSFRSQLQWANQSLSFFFLEHFQDNLYYFSFNPYLMNYRKIYQTLFKGSLYETITKPICEAQDFKKDKIMCSEYFPGRYLNNRGYRAIVVDNDSDEPEVYHLGTGFHVNTMLQSKNKTIFCKILILIMVMMQIIRLILLYKQRGEVQNKRKSAQGFGQSQI